MFLHPAPRHRLPIGLLALFLLVGLGATVIVATTPDDTSGSTSASRTRLDSAWRAAVDDGAIPWPEEGQTAVGLQGMAATQTRGEQLPVPIASLTKVMTAYVILKDHPLEPGEPGPRIEVDRQATNEAGVGDESSVPVRAGQRYSQHQLLQMLLIPSANNVARLLARWDSGSQGAFAKKMRNTADELGMDHSTYTGASEIEASTTSTAADQLELTRQAIKIPVFRDIVASPTATVPGIGLIHNSNPLLGTSGVVGIKTGSSTPAGGNLLRAAEVRVGDRTRLFLGAVLHQRANTTPDEGLQAALDSSRALIDGLRDQLASARTES
ncbi:D-alanyl-D-alanine carboxypeptidase family protein [Streptomyces mirabilis]|uniref:D-alanyl-D-alanine carboxypeptidase family protein n=1 Tax=Streptomyces mirabilis TaxID=68239 RepID=UPI003669FE55